MEPLVYVMAIFGCGDLGDQCAPVRELPARYATLDACRAQAGAALLANSDLDAPELSAQCRRSDRTAAAQQVAALAR